MGTRFLDLRPGGGLRRRPRRAPEVEVLQDDGVAPAAGRVAHMGCCVPPTGGQSDAGVVKGAVGRAETVEDEGGPITEARRPKAIGRQVADAAVEDVLEGDPSGQPSFGVVNDPATASFRAEDMGWGAKTS